MSLIEDQLSKMDPKELLKMVQSFIRISPEINEKDPMIQIVSTNKRKNYETDLNPSHALVFWNDDKKYSVIQYKSIELEDDIVAGLNKEYEMHFKSKLYRGRVVMIGSKFDCEKHYVNINSEMDYSVELETNQNSTNKKKTTIKEMSEIHSLKNKITQLTDEKEVFKMKMIDNENNHRETKKENIDLKKENIDLKKENLNLKKQLSEDKEIRETVQKNFCKYCFNFYQYIELQFQFL